MTDTPSSSHPETLVLHGGGWRSDSATNAIAVPLYQTTSYQFDSVEHAANLFGLKELGNIYTRIMNPTTAVLEDRLAALEGGIAGLAVASGQAAITLALQTLAAAGDNIVTSPHLYGGTWNLLTNTLPAMGIEVRFADPHDPDSFVRLTDDRTRAYFAETLPNPKLDVFPIAEVAELGRGLGIPLIVDNTAAPLTCRPFEHGAAIIIHSLTKYIGGHGTSIGGVIIDSGSFDWRSHPERQPLLNRPDASYHGAVWAEIVPQALGAPIAYLIRARVVLLRDLGPALSPGNAFHFIQGLETLPLRFERQQQNAAILAEYLSSHPAVETVIFPSYFEGLQAERAARYLSCGWGAIVGVELAGGVEAGIEFINRLKLIYHVANIGDVRTLAIHPASTTHSQLSEADQLTSGVTPGYVRFSVGIEHHDDIIADIAQALSTEEAGRTV